MKEPIDDKKEPKASRGIASQAGEILFWKGKMFVRAEARRRRECILHPRLCFSARGFNYVHSVNCHRNRVIEELTRTIREVAPKEVWITHGREDALMHWCMLNQVKARELNLVGYEDEDE